MLSVYENSNGFRVVAGAHVPATEHKKLQPRIYSTAAAAYATETNARIRDAILKLDPAAAGETTPANRHHVRKALASLPPCKPHFTHVLAPLDAQCIHCGCDMSSVDTRRLNAFGTRE